MSKRRLFLKADFFSFVICTVIFLMLPSMLDAQVTGSLAEVDDPATTTVDEAPAVSIVNTDYDVDVDFYATVTNSSGSSIRVKVKVEWEEKTAWGWMPFAGGGGWVADADLDDGDTKDYDSGLAFFDEPFQANKEYRAKIILFYDNSAALDTIYVEFST